MARTSVLEKPTSIRALGAILVAIMVFLVWVTYAFFDKQFVKSEPVYITTERTGVNLPENADVKLRGMIVGEVRTIEPYREGVRMTLAMKPEAMKDVPRDVSAQILPKTLFGEKYVALIPGAESASGQSLQAGDTIKKAVVPIEVEDLLKDAYPLLNSIDPANLSYTLTAVSQALTGRGEQLGSTLVTLNDYLQEIDPEVPQLVDDLTTLGTVSDGFASAMPDLGRLLRNAVKTGNTVVEKQSELAAFLDAGTDLSNTLTDFTKVNGEALVNINHRGKPFLQMAAKQSATFQCFLGGMAQLIPRLDNVFRDQMLHIDVELIAPTTAYGKDEPLSGSPSDFDRASSGPPAKNGSDINANNAATPSCVDLNRMTPIAKKWLEADSNSERKAAQDDLNAITKNFVIPPAVYRLVNVKEWHGKFASSQAEWDASGRVAVASSDAPVGGLGDLVRASLTDVGGSAMGVTGR